MKLRFRLGVAFLLLVQFSFAQKRQQPLFQPATTFNNIFDRLIVNDSTVPVFEYKDTILTPARDSLVYNFQDHWNCKLLKCLLDDNIHSNQEKINLLKAFSQY